MGSNLEKISVVSQIRAFEFALLQSLEQRYKSLNLGPKIHDVRYFGLEFEKGIVICEISVLEFVQLQSLEQKEYP